ncbi:DNA-binding protein [Marinobacter sp. M3C]|jgi:chromosome segregation ATPase|uniref:DNA-binding protein n=1 Tax=Marinobacter sp. M3C TaxID=2917715 RepID=UPI0032C472AC
MTVNKPHSGDKMARPASITQEDVRAAVTALEENGKPINPYQVRKLLSKGSIAKIAYYLKALGVDVVYETDDPLTSRLALLLRPAALELEEQTDERIRIETEQLRNDIHERDVALADLESRLEKKQSQLKIQEKRLSQATVDGDWLRSEKQLLEVKVARLDAAHKGQAKQLEVQSDQIAYLKEKNVEAQSEFQSTLSEHRKVVRTIREDHHKAIDEHKAAVASVTEKLRELSQNNDLTVFENHKLQTEVAKLTGDHRIAIQNAETKIELLQNEQCRLGEENQKLSAQCSALMQEKDAQAQKCQVEFQALERELVAVVSDRRRLLSDNAKLTSDLDFLRALISKFEIPLAAKENPDS